MNKKKLHKARNKIDKIDKTIFNLIKKRTKIVDHMRQLKQHKKQIIDHKRIAEILSMIKKRSKRNNIDPRITSQIWKSMIWAYVKYQRRNFKKK